MAECDEENGQTVVTQEENEIPDLLQEGLTEELKDQLDRVEEGETENRASTDIFLDDHNIYDLRKLIDSAHSKPPEPAEGIYLDDGTNTKTDSMGWRGWNSEDEEWVDIGGALGFWDGAKPPNVRQFELASGFPVVSYTDTGQPYVKAKVQWSDVEVLDIKGYTLQITSKEGVWEGGDHYFEEKSLGVNANESVFSNLEQDTEYYVRIKAEDIEGLSSDRWSEVTIPPVSTDDPEPPSSISVNSVQNGVKATWNNPDDRGFRETYVLIKEGEAPTKDNYNDDNRKVTGSFDYLTNGNINNYTLDTTDRDTTFYFGFFSVDLTGKDSELETDSSYSASPAHDTLADIPSDDYIDDVLVGDRIIGIIFDHGQWSGFDRYRLSYQYDPQDGSGWNGSWIEILEDRTPGYKHSNLYRGYLYKYRLEIIDEDGKSQDTTIDDNNGSGYQPDKSDNQDLINSDTVLSTLIVAEEEVRAPNLYITDLADIEKKLTVSDQVEIGEDVLGSDQEGIRITDTSNNPRIDIGNLSSGYGVQIRDSNGDLILDSATAPDTDGQISGVYLKEINASDVTSGSMSTDYLDPVKQDAITIDGSLSITGDIQSNNYEPGNDGWKIDGEGKAYLNEAEVRGTLYVSDITLDGNWNQNNIVIDGDLAITGAIQSDVFDEGSSGWKIWGDGTAEFNDVAVRGEIDGSEYKMRIEVRSSDPSTPEDGRLWVVQ